MLDLTDIPSHERHDDLGPDAGRDEVSDSAHGRIEATLHAPHPLVGVRIGPVEAHGNVSEAGADQFPCKLRRAENAVGLHVEAQLLLPENLEDLPNLRVHERLAARELHGRQAQRLCLLQDLPEQRRVQGRVLPLFRLMGRLDPAVPAPQVASLGEVEVERIEGRNGPDRRLARGVAPEDRQCLSGTHNHDPPRPAPVESTARVSSLTR